jgi:hypothetical protein
MILVSNTATEASTGAVSTVPLPSLADAANGSVTKRFSTESGHIAEQQILFFFFV